MTAKMHDRKNGNVSVREFCQNQYCDDPGAKLVPVSVETPSDETRTLRVTCEEAYTMGFQHATKMAQATHHQS